VTLSPEAERLQQETYVVDGLFTAAPAPSIVNRVLKTGYNAVNWTVSAHADSTDAALNKIATFYWLRDAMPDKVTIVTSAADLEAPEHEGKLKIVMGFQGMEPISHQFHYVSIFHALGVRVMQLTYNEGNRLGAGCLEPDDRGLTHFGLQVVRELNRLRMLIDLSHVGVRSSLDAIAESAQPVIFSHSNARAVRENARNLTDEQIKACAERGGVIGIATFADFVGDTHQGQSTIEKFLDHICYVADKVGVDHVGIGTDIMEATGPKGIWWNANTKRRYPEVCGAMDEHMHGIKGFELWDEFGNATEGLLRRGFSEEDVRKIIGGNFLRTLKEVLA
jgi:membrane dipeptidase